MITEILQQPDSIKAIAENVSSKTDVVSHLSFNFDRIDSTAITLTILGYGVVFLALVFLYLTIFNIAKILNFVIRKKLEKQGSKSTKEEINIPGEINAAISMALLLHFQEVHDFENTVLTIKKVQRPYSPWSSKLYGLRQYPKK